MKKNIRHLYDTSKPENLFRYNDRMDADLSYFFEEELTVYSEAVMTQYPILTYNKLMTTYSGDDVGANAVGMVTYDTVGMTKIARSGAKESPSVSVYATKESIPMIEIFGHYSMTEDEINAARLARRNGRNRARIDTPLDTAKLLAVITTFEKHHNDLAVRADGTNNDYYGGKYGMIYNANTTKVAATDIWENLTNDEILEEIDTIYRGVLTDTNEIHTPDTFALSGERMAFLRARKTANDVSLLSILKETYSGVRFIEYVGFAKAFVTKNPSTLAAGNFNVMMCYSSSPTVIRYRSPRKFFQYPPTTDGRGGFKIECSAKTAGTEVQHPYAVVCYYGF